MDKLQRIGDLSVRYDITNRTLRYYEEIGLLTSTRKGDSPYRYYDSEAINKLEQILILKEMQLSIKEIREILTSRKKQIFIEILSRKLNSIEETIESNEELIKGIKAFLEFLQREYQGNDIDMTCLIEKTISLMKKDVGRDEKERKEEVIIMTEKIKKPLADVRIIELKPFKVAYYVAESSSPEIDAWNVMLEWAENEGLTELSTSRFFGFNNPNPSQDNPVYGYEVWISVLDNVKPSGKIKIKNFEGGLYAVTNTHIYEIAEKWREMVGWVKESNFELAEHQWLEETISPVKMPDGDTQADIYCPIKRKD